MSGMLHNSTVARGRRGRVIIAVLVVVTMAALVGSAILLRSDGGVVLARGELRRAQARAAAWSGVQAVMARLGEQREDLLAGGAPVLPEGWTMPVEAAGGTLVFRLLPGAGGLPATSENARLDLNTADAEMLASLSALDDALAQRIVQQRPAGGYSSVESLAAIEGIGRAMLAGGVDSGAAPPSAAGDLGDAVGSPLLDLLTVWSFDPNVQGAAAGETIGARRVPFPGGWWTDATAMAIGERFGSPSLFGVGGIGVGGEAPATLGALVGALRGSAIPVESWGPMLDTLTPHDATHRRGLVDMNRAGAEVLAALPGIDEEMAAEIVEARERTSLESRGSIAWAVEVGVMTPEALEESADWLTVRSTQWRVRIEGGYEPPSAGERRRGDEARALLDRVVYEAVIDVSTRRPRLATLREITGLDESLALSPSPEDPTTEGIDEEADDLDGLGPDEPEFIRLGRGPERLVPRGEDPAPSGPPQDAAADDQPGQGESRAGGGAAGRVGRWTGGGGA